MNHRGIFLIALTLLIIGAFASIHADSWALPKKAKYFAPNKKYYLEVTPKKLESQLKYSRIKLKEEIILALSKVPQKTEPKVHFMLAVSTERTQRNGSSRF